MSRSRSNNDARSRRSSTINSNSGNGGCRWSRSDGVISIRSNGDGWSRRSSSDGVSSSRSNGECGSKRSRSITGSKCNGESRMSSSDSIDDMNSSRSNVMVGVGGQ